MSLHRLGPLLILLFTVSQSVRDVYFGSLFQGVGVFAVVLLAFAISTLLFGAIVIRHKWDELAGLWRHRQDAIAMIVTTAFTWPCYFFALSQVDPSIVNTIHSGVGLLVASALALGGSRLTGRSTMGTWQHVCHAGIAATLVGLCWVVLSGRSGVSAASTPLQLAGLAAVLISGTAITISLLYAKRLNVAGISSETVTASRYLLLLALAAVFEMTRVPPPAQLSLGNIGGLAVATTTLMVLPLFILQVGIAHTHPVTAHLIRALGPVLVFAFEQFDSRIRYSGWVMTLIVAYSIFAVATNLVELRRKSARLTTTSPARAAAAEATEAQSEGM